MTVSKAIRAAAERLSATSDTARLDAELLMAHALGMSRSDMLIQAMDRPQPAAFHALIERRRAYEPVAYITGVQEFFGRPFKVTRNTLIPRPDSETIVEAALEALGDIEVGEVLDLGTGTGALLLSVLAERTGLTGTGIDRSGGALEVARENAQRLDLSDRAKFENLDWTKRNDQGDPWYMGLPAAALILANPPYVEDEADIGPNVKDYEPAGALFAGPEGLDDYRIIIPDLAKVLANGGKAVLEIGATQAVVVTELAEKSGFRVEIRHDLANRPRALVLSSGIWE